MASFNRVMLLGNLTRDPQLKYLPSQTPVVDFGIACNRRFKTAQGEDREEVLFVDCSAFGRQAEVINQYLADGAGRVLPGVRVETLRISPRGGNLEAIFTHVTCTGGDTRTHGEPYTDGFPFPGPGGFAVLFAPPPGGKGGPGGASQNKN